MSSCLALQLQRTSTGHTQPGHSHFTLHHVMHVHLPDRMTYITSVYHTLRFCVDMRMDISTSLPALVLGNY